MCGGQYLIIEEIKPTLTGEEAGLKFNEVKHKERKKEVQTRLD